MSASYEFDPQAADAVAAQADEVLGRLSSLADENEALGRELLRCYEQLSLVFEITEHIATLQDPRTILEALLRRYGTMLGAGAIYSDMGADCVRVLPLETASPPIDLEADVVRAALAADIDAVRQNRRTAVPALSDEARAALRGAHAMLGALPQFNSETCVVISLRDGGEPAFDSGDRLAAESVLGYGGHILSNVLMVRHLQQTALETVRALANAIDAKDNYTHGHSERVGWLARFTGRSLGMSAPQLQVLEWAGLLHDVGKIGVSESILNKPGKLTEEEFEEMKRHPRLSYEVLKPVQSLEPVLPGVLHHHENHDGSGYPDKLRGEEIPLTARILHVVDIFDALTSTRSYRKGFPVEDALTLLERDAGRVTDPHVTYLFLRAFRQYMSEQPADFRQRFPHIAESLPQNQGQAHGA